MGALLVKKLPASAGNMGLLPGQDDPTCRRAINPCTTTTEAVLWSLEATVTEA